MEQFSPQAAEIIKAIRLLPLEEQRKIAEEVIHQVEELNVDQADCPNNHLPNSLLSPKTKTTYSASGKAPAAVNPAYSKHQASNIE